MTPEALLQRFSAAGATPVEAPILQPAEALLDLYGEDIRARAYTTTDPMRGEMMLRPDFTMSVVQQHLSQADRVARYTYAGPVFRRQEDDPTRPSEYAQVGIELVGSPDAAAADAEVFALIAEALDRKAQPQTGDIGLLTAAVDALQTSEARKAALRRHIWRPGRFRALIERFSKLAPRRAVPVTGAPVIGKRTSAEIAARHAALAADAETPPLAADDIARLDQLLSLSAPARAAADQLRTLAPASAVARLTARLDALDARGINTETLPFQTTFGRTLLEYYDGFVFGFFKEGSLVATGGRYDALTRILGQGRETPAVGGVIRPALL